VSPARLSRLAPAIAEARVDGLIVCRLPNIRYLTGFTGSSALLLVAAEGGGETVLFTDGRYKTQAAQEAAGLRVVVARRSVARALAGSVKRRRLRRLAFESRGASFELYETLRSRLPGVRLKPVANVVEKLRMIKSAEEIEKIRRAAELNSAAFQATLSEVRPGSTEAEVANRIDYQMRALGAEKPAFDTIVASGPRSALPHARATSKALASGELILIDQGAILDGYSSDMTRTVALGDVSARAREVYHAVLEAQLAAISEVRAGVRAAQVDGQARKTLEKHGLEKSFVHSTGHGVGLEVHEHPRLGRGEKTRLEAGMVITIEPGAYLEGLGGVRIEDLVLVTERGAEVLTSTPKDLLVL